MPKYLIAYRKVEESGQKPEWAVFTTDSELSLEAHAVKERVEKRMSVLGEKLWGNGETALPGDPPGELEVVEGQARGGTHPRARGRADGVHHRLRAGGDVRDRDPALPGVALDTGAC